MRHHLSEQAVQKAVRASTQSAGVSKAVSPHLFATHLIESGTEVRTVQALLDHASVDTTLIDTHVLYKGGQGVRSPADRLLGEEEGGA